MDGPLVSIHPLCVPDVQRALAYQAERKSHMEPCPSKALGALAVARRHILTQEDSLRSRLAALAVRYSRFSLTRFAPNRAPLVFQRSHSLRSRDLRSDKGPRDDSPDGASPPRPFSPPEASRSGPIPSRRLPRVSEAWVDQPSCTRFTHRQPRTDVTSRPSGRAPAAVQCCQGVGGYAGPPEL